MRPTVSVPDSKEYECPACGERVTDPDTKLCAECGTSFVCLGLSRDL